MAAGEPRRTATAPPPAVAPPAGHPRFPQVDALRAIAAIAVVVTHTAVFGGFDPHAPTTALLSDLAVGVPIFFVISGFLLYRPLLAARLLGAPRTSLRTYAWRRALRIVPAYWVALTVLGWWVNLPGVFTGDWWRYYLFLQVYSRHTLYGGILPAWTLCIEVTFYALVPVWSATLRRLGARGDRPDALRRELQVLAVAAVGSVVLRTVDLAGPRTVLDNTLLENFDWFAAGMALAVASVAVQSGRALPRPARVVVGHPGAAWAAALAVYVALAFAVPDAAVLHGGVFFQTPGRGLVLHLGWGVIAVLLAAPAVFGHGGIPARVLAGRALRWLGLISYGIYLWHDPLLGKLLAHGALGWWPGEGFAVLTVTTLAAAIVAAAVSYYVVERPILARKELTPWAAGSRRRAHRDAR